MKLNLSKKISLAEKKYNSTIEGEWIGFNNSTDIYLQLYIQKKYKESLFFLPYVRLYIAKIEDEFTNDIILKEAHTDEYYSFENEANRDKMEKYLIKYRNTKKRFTYFNFIYIFLEDKNVLSTDSYHSVTGIYDSKFNTIEIFDNVNNLSPFKSIFKKFFKDIYSKNVKVILLNKCIKFGKKEYYDCTSSKYLFKSEGFCAIWAIWYLELRVKNLDLDRDILINKAIKEFNKGNERICKFIRGYAQFVEQIIKNYSVVKTKNGVVIRYNKYTEDFIKLLYGIIASISIYKLIKN